MLIGAHVLLYSQDPEADRAFFRDVLEFPSVDAGVGAALQAPRLTSLVRVMVDDEIRAWDLFLERPDKTYSFTDCTSSS